MQSSILLSTIFRTPAGCETAFTTLAAVLVGVALAVLSTVLLSLISGKILQILQLSGYKTRGFNNWIKLTKGDYLLRYFGVGFFSLAAMLIYVACFGKYVAARYVGLLFLVTFCVLFRIFNRKERQKTPLRNTPRIMRLRSVLAVLYAVESLLLVWLGAQFFAGYALLGILPALVPYNVLLAHYITKPFEMLNNYGYKVKATARLKERPELIRIGITGSYGKTTEKAIAAKLLSVRYRVCASRLSYNTPMGIAKVVNNELEENDTVFIAEMGARNVGDIKELADIVKPNFGIITTIGNQHLETFGTRENIKKTKYELIENLAPAGLALFNGDSADNIELYEKTEGPKILTGKRGLPHVVISYDNVVVSGNGTEFDLYDGKQSVHFTTKLLGKHIPGLITLAVALAKQLGIEPSETVQAVAQLEPVPHRLELIEGNGVLIIDDAYNSNIEGAINALGVLKEIDRYKVIITPGLVELGSEEAAMNTKLGEEIGRVCDSAIFVGPLSEVLKQGALSVGMDANCVFCAPDLYTAVAILRQLPKDNVVLFENDLPDNY